MSPGPETTSHGRARDVFLDAIEKPPGERAAFIQAACRSDAKLRAEVEELLREHEQVGDFLAMPASAGQSPAAAPQNCSHRRT